MNDLLKLFGWGYIIASSGWDILDRKSNPSKPGTYLNYRKLGKYHERLIYIHRPSRDSYKTVWDFKYTFKEMF